MTEIHTVEEAFSSFILKNDHPCLMAKSVMTDEQYRLRCYASLGSRTAATALLPDLKDYLARYSFSEPDFYTFIAAFPDEEAMDEKTFEQKLWRQLQYLHEADDEPWDPEVSSDPESAHFSFSVGGRAFYIVGMHPHSSRIARRSPYPAIIFNLHHQFEMLREMGAYERIRDQIRERDMKLQGTVNPMMKDFGDASEARQYSGRKTDKNWKCPFHPSTD